MSSGSSSRHNSGSKGFDFGTDDILCSYEDFADQENSNGSQSDPGIGTNSAKELHKSRLARSSVSPSSAYNSSPQEESSNQQQEMLIIVERTMKKHTDNLMRFLEGISSRLTQLELYCYNLDKSIGEIRSDLVRDHTDSDSNLKSLDKHIQEVHRSVQILRDKQELAETQKELAKLQLAQKESSSSTPQTQQTEGRSSPAPPPSDKMTETPPDMYSQQLALALPHQVPPQPVGPPPSIPQSQSYYQQAQYLPSDSPYRNPPQQSQANPMPQIHQFSQYQQQWGPQVQPQPQPQQQIRPSSNTIYPPYLPSQPTNPNPTEPMQMQFAGLPEPGSTRPKLPYGYGGSGRTGPPQSGTQQLKPGYGSQPGEGYPTLSSLNTYMMYESDGGRAQQPHFPPGGYPANPQTSSSGNLMACPPQLPRNHPYNELIEKLVSMGFRGDHVVGVIQRIEESGQHVDFNSVLDRLNGHSSIGSQRGWQN